VSIFRKNFAVQTQTRLVRAPKVETTSDEQTSTLYEDLMTGPEMVAEYADIAKDFITHTAVVVTGAYVICRIARALTK
jgi:hypothetical protein